jgi:hypothetical protein
MEAYAGKQFVGIDLHRRRSSDRSEPPKLVRCWRRCGSSMTAYLGGASPVLQVRDSRLRWGAGTDSNGQCRWVKLR